MYIDKDSGGRFAIMDLTAAQLRLILEACRNAGPEQELLELVKRISHEIHAGRY